MGRRVVIRGGTLDVQAPGGTLCVGDVHPFVPSRCPDPAKEVELLSIALDASYTHLFALGTRRHVQNALKAGATIEELMGVPKRCVVQGVQACNLAVPILAEELGDVHRARGR
jgi:hypothetical protein